MKNTKLKSLILLFLIIFALFTSLFIGVFGKKGASFEPKFALDLEGGTEIVLTPIATNDKQVTEKDIQQAINIIRQRVDSSGVSEAEITSQGGSNIVVGIPGNPSEQTLDLVRRSAKMTFRTVLAQKKVDQDQQEANLAQRKYTIYKNNDPYKDQSPKTYSKKTKDALSLSDADTTKVANEDEYNNLLKKALNLKITTTDSIKNAYDSYSCDMSGTANSGYVSDPNKPLVTCDSYKYYKYILGPVMLDGSLIDSATAGADSSGSSGQWVVNLKFTGKGNYGKNGTKQFSSITKKLAKYPKRESKPNQEPPSEILNPRNEFAIVLDDQVLSSPGVNEAISTGSAQISGSFDQNSANQLADQLNFGALPLEFKVQSEDTVSATLGSEQLEKGLLAGIIGLLLVGFYSFLQYRALGSVTVASLAISGLITYGSILLLSWLQGYRLSLAGVTGIIVSIGITADSFIVFFERVKDEIRNGRDMNSSVKIGWDRAKRTILASDTVNFIAALVLYFLSVGGVRGFAFTLGLTTIVDVVVVFLFTHPIIRYLIGTEFFGAGHPASGFDPIKLGALNAVSFLERKKRFEENKEQKESFIKRLKKSNVGSGFKDKEYKKIVQENIKQKKLAKEKLKIQKAKIKEKEKLKIQKAKLAKKTIDKKKLRAEKKEAKKKLKEQKRINKNIQKTTNKNEKNSKKTSPNVDNVEKNNKTNVERNNKTNVERNNKTTKTPDKSNLSLAMRKRMKKGEITKELNKKVSDINNNDKKQTEKNNIEKNDNDKWMVIDDEV